MTRWRFLLVAILVQFFALFLITPASAGTCTGSPALPSIFYVLFNADTDTCTVQASNAGLPAGSLRLRFAAQNYIYTADNDLDGTPDTVDHQGCVVGDNQTVAAGHSCVVGVANTVNGPFTNSITAKTSATKTVTITINMTLTAGVPTTLDSVSFTLVETAPASNPQSSADTATPSVVQAAVSLSQTTVAMTNLGSRLSAIANPAVSGAGRDAPGGLGRDAPGGLGRDVPGGPIGGSPTDGGPTDGSQDGTANLIGESRTEGYDWAGARRKLALMASFDSSQVTPDAGTRPLGPEGIRSRSEVTADRAWTIWGHGSYTRVENDRNTASEDSRYDGDVWGYNLGVDYRFAANLYAGLSAGYAETALSTLYNSGSYDETTWSLSPYAVYKPSDRLSLSAVLGYSLGKLDLERNAGITASADTAQWFGALNAAYRMSPLAESPLDLTAKAGVVAIHKTIDGYTESDGTDVAEAHTNTHQMRTGLEAAYPIALGETAWVKPYAEGAYLYDFVNPTNGDDDAVALTSGVRFGADGTGLSGSVEGSRQLGRSDYTETTFSGLIAYSFDMEESDAVAENAEPYLSLSGDTGLLKYGAGLRLFGASGAVKTDIAADLTDPTDNGNGNATQTVSVTARISVQF